MDQIFLPSSNGVPSESKLATYMVIVVDVEEEEEEAGCGRRRRDGIGWLLC